MEIDRKELDKLEQHCKKQILNSIFDDVKNEHQFTFDLIQMYKKLEKENKMLKGEI